MLRGQGSCRTTFQQHRISRLCTPGTVYFLRRIVRFAHVQFEWYLQSFVWHHCYGGGLWLRRDVVPFAAAEPVDYMS